MGFFGTTDSSPWRLKRKSICGQKRSLPLYSATSNYNGMYEKFETIWCLIIYDLSTLKLCFSNQCWFGHFWWWRKCSCCRSLNCSQLVLCVWNFVRWLYVVSTYIHCNHRPLQEYLVFQKGRAIIDWITLNRLNSVAVVQEPIVFQWYNKYINISIFLDQYFWSMPKSTKYYPCSNPR